MNNPNGRLSERPNERAFEPNGWPNLNKDEAQEALLVYVADRPEATLAVWRVAESSCASPVDERRPLRPDH